MEVWQQKIDAMNRRCDSRKRKPVESLKRFKGSRYEVVEGLTFAPHRVIDTHLKSIVGNYRELSKANEIATKLDAECVKPTSRRKLLAAAALLAVLGVCVLMKG